MTENVPFIIEVGKRYWRRDKKISGLIEDIKEKENCVYDPKSGITYFVNGFPVNAAFLQETPDDLVKEYHELDTLNLNNDLRHKANKEPITIHSFYKKDDRVVFFSFNRNPNRFYKAMLTELENIPPQTINEPREKRVNAEAWIIKEPIENAQVFQLRLTLKQNIETGQQHLICAGTESEGLEAMVTYTKGLGWSIEEIEKPLPILPDD